MCSAVADYPPPPLLPSANRFTLPYLALKGHKFFIPNPNAPKGAGANDNFLVKNYKKLNAVTRYFNYLLLGNPALTQKHSTVFDPKDGLRWRPEYVRKFGYRGDRLIAFLGSGPTKEQVKWSLGSVY